MRCLLLPLLWTVVTLSACSEPVADAADGRSGADVGKDATAPTCSPLEGELRLNHVQMLATHNSYHVAKEKPVVAELNYSHDPLPVQLESQGVRSFELDLHHLGPDKPIAVMHIQFIDNLATCTTLGECLGQLKSWSDAHPCHHPLVVTLECKDELEASDVADHMEQFEQEVLAVWPKERLVKPDDVRGSADTLAAGLHANGWPTLGESRGKLALVLYDGEGLFDKYRKLHPGLRGAVAFVFGTPGDPDTAVLLRDNPTDPQIGDLAKQGYLIRTFPSPTAQASQAALASGAHLVSTDYPVVRARLPGFSLQLPGGAPSRCNPMTAPPTCTAAAINAGVGNAVNP